MKKTLFFLISIILLIFISFSAFGYNDNEIKIGLTNKSGSQISVLNNSILVGNEKNCTFPLSSQNGFLIKTENGIFIKLNSSLDYSQSLNQKSYGNYTAYPILTENNKYNIYIGAFNSVSEAQGFLAENNLNGEVLTASNSLGIYSNEKLCYIYALDQNMQIIPVNSEPIKLGDKQYRGKLEILNNSGALTAINVISIDEYLYSVVGSEMPASWAKEALKAQAVASRSYSYTKKGTHSSSDYDLCDSTHCQLYTGLSGEADSVITAVNETKGIMAYYNNEVINGVFCSSNGGYSADSESVWNYACPYLVAVEDSQEKGGKAWERTFTLAELSSIAGVGSIQSLSAEKDSISGRVNKLTIKGSSGEKILERESIRTFFSSLGGSLESRNFDILQGKTTTSAITSNTENSLTKIYAQGKDSISHLSENLYAVSANSKAISINEAYVIDKGYNKTALSLVKEKPITLQASTQTITSSDSTSVTFRGRGWGHGVGMSQFGAKTMAENGSTFDEILKHYYTGIELK